MWLIGAAAAFGAPPQLLFCLHCTARMLDLVASLSSAVSTFPFLVLTGNILGAGGVSDYVVVLSLKIISFSHYA